jgi:ribose/xylose/arabinose/galactoside ABC-type transport system permease subunit
MRALLRRGTDLALTHSGLLFLACILIYFGIQVPSFLSVESLGNIVKQASFIGVAALGMTFVLMTAGIDLSVGAVMFLAPLVAGLAMRHLGLPVPAGFVVAVLTGAALGSINAFFIVGLRVVPFVVTLATTFLFRGFGIWLTSSTQFDFSEDMRKFGSSSVFNVATPIVIFATMAVIMYVALSHTQFGRQIYALGNDREAARKAGLKVARLEASVYIISAACAAISGFVIIAQIGRLDAGFGEGREFDVIAAAILGGASFFGGVGTAFGAVLGAILIQAAKLGLVFTGVNLYLQPLVLGAIIFLAVLADGVRTRRLSEKSKRTIRPKSVSPEV